MGAQRTVRAILHYSPDIQVEKLNVQVQGRSMRNAISRDKLLTGDQGMGAIKAVTAQATEQVPKAALHPRSATGATGAATVPNVKPAAA